MNKEIITADKHDSVRSAIRKMIGNNLGSVVITYDDQPVGIVTERDILKSIAYKRADADGEVVTIMKAPPISVDT